MTSTSTCPKCGKPLPSDGPQGLCPECLLKAAFPSESAHESAATGLFEPSPATPTPFDAGTRLKYFGDYELLEEIARVGMGVEWKARQSTMNRDVALKMIRAGALASPDEVARFLREAEAAANLQHPNIVAIHEVGEHQGQHYFSMDLVNGRDLGALITEGPLAPQRAARYVKIIAEAIHFAHQRGTLHRDLKPQNVLIDAVDQPRITDFGLAKIMKDDSQLTQSGVVMGSPSYMSPEQAAGRPGDIGPASDVYCLGAMLYELLTGRPPFRGATAMATLHDVMESEPASPRRLKSDIPPDLETICLKCLEKSPASRYSTARALAEELDRFLKGEPIQVRPASSLRKMVSWTRRHPGAVAALAAMVIVALALGVYYLWEENSFLQAKIADPSLERTPGWRHDALENWALVNFFVMGGGLIAFIAVRAKSRGLPFRDALDRRVNERPLQPLDGPARARAVVAAPILIGCGVVYLAIAIQAKVWEGELILGPLGSLGHLDPFPLIVFIYLPIWLGLHILGMIVRDYRIVNYGTPISAQRQPTLEMAATIRATMETWDFDEATKLYRKAFPEAGKREAMLYIHGIANALRAEQPDKFACPPLALENISWQSMVICAVFEAVVAGVVWAVFPPAYPLAAALFFAGNFVLGMWLGALPRVKGLWKRLILLAPGLLLLIVTQVVLQPAGSSWGSIGPLILAFFLGVLLVFCGLAGEAGRALRKKLRSTR